MNPPGHTLQRGDKVRPAIVLTPHSTSSDVLLAFISSVIKAETIQPTDFILEENHSGFHATGLKKTSVFRMSKLLTVEKSMILRRLGKASLSLQKELDLKLKIATGL